MRKLTFAVVLMLICSILALAAEKKVVRPSGAEPSASWSHGILIDNTLYVSGMAGENASGKIPTAFEDEMKQALDNVDSVLKAVGMSS